MHTETLIVGGGLSGLSLARSLHQSGREFLLLEARDRLGGRISSRLATGLPESDARYDLGPAWFWPGQAHMNRLVEELGLTVYEQHCTGRLVMQESDGSIRYYDHSTMAGSLRIEGGMLAIIDGIASTLPVSRVLLNHTVRSAANRESGIIIRSERHTSESSPQLEISAKRLVLALPPRLVHQGIQFHPQLLPSESMTMKSIPTWMAGHCKVVAIYKRPFWRSLGFSGDGMSRRGPLVEIHDASPRSGIGGALFGFVGIPPAHRAGDLSTLIEGAIAQLAMMFGAQAAHPVEILLKDWATDDLTATPEDLASPSGHPCYGVPSSLAHLWGGRLKLASTEMASEYGGYLEGACEAAAAVFEAFSHQEGI